MALNLRLGGRVSSMSLEPPTLREKAGNKANPDNTQRDANDPDPFVPHNAAVSLGG